MDGFSRFILRVCWLFISSFIIRPSSFILSSESYAERDRGQKKGKFLRAAIGFLNRGNPRVSRVAFGIPRITDCRSYSAGFDFVAALFRLRGRFRDFGAAPLRTAATFCSFSEADAARRRRSRRSLRSFFSLK